MDAGIVRWLHGIVFMLGAGYTLLHGGHVRVDIFYRPKSARFKAWVDLGGSLVLLLPVMALIMWTSWGYVLASWSKFEESREAGGLPSLFLLEDRYMGVLQLIALATAQGVGEEAIYLQARATETRVRSMDLSDYRILAFATHGLVSGEMKGLAEPSLVFTPLQWGVIAPPFSCLC